MADKRMSYGSIEELMSIDPKVAKMITGEYFQEKIDRQVGKDEAQKQAEREAAQKAMAVRSIKAGANELAGIYSEEGYDVRYTIDSETMKVQMFLIPREVKNKEKLTTEELKQYKTVDIFLNNNRVIDKNGQRGIGGIVPVEIGDDVGIYSFAEHQIWAQVEEAKKQYAKQQLKDRTAEGNKTYTKAMRRARRKASSQQATAGQQVPLTAKGRDARSGTGTKEQIALRDEMVFADHILSQFLTDKNIQKTLKRGYKKAEHGSYEAYLNKLQNAAFGIAGLLSKGWTEEEIAKSDPMYKIITTSSSLMGKLKKLSQLGLYHTLTSESAGSNFIYSAMPKSAISGGWADEESSNKRLKVSNRMEVLNPTAKENKTKISGSLTPFEKAAGIDVSDIERRLYAIQKRKIDFFNKARKILYNEKVTNGSMTEEEFVKEYGTELSGLGLDSLIYSSEIEEGLGGFEYRPEKIDTDKIRREVERLKRVKKDENHTDEDWTRMAVAGLLDIAEEDITAIDSESSDKFVRIEYKFKQEMMSGFKLLLQQAYERGAAIKVHKDIFDVARDVEKMASVGETALSKESTLIEEAGPLKAKGISGFLAQTMAAVTAEGKMNPTARKKINAILEKTGLGDYVKWDPATRGYLEDYSSFENKTDSEKEAYFNNIIPVLNDLTKAIGVATKDIVKIETDKEGKTTYIVSDEWVGRTAANQISQYRYGEPGGEVVSYGYRGRGAINRAIAMASVTKKGEKQNLDDLNSFLMDVTNVDEESQKFYNKAKEDAEDSRKRTLASAAADFKINEEKNEALFKITEEQLKADREINEARTAGGYFDKEAFEKTSMYAIYKMMHPDDPNAPGKKVYIDYGKAGTVAQTDENGKKIWGSSATALTDFQVEEVRDKSGAVIGYKLNENLAKGYRGIVEARERYGEIGGDSQHNLELLTDAAIEYGKIVHDDVESKEGVSWNKGNVTKVAHSMFAMTEAANYALLEELFNDATLEISDTDFSKLSKEQQLEIAKKRNLRHVLSSAEQMSAEDAAELMRAHGDTKQTAHMSTLMKEYERIYGKDVGEWYKEQQRLDAEEQKKEAEVEYHNRLNSIEADYNNDKKRRDYYLDENGNEVRGFEENGKWVTFAELGKRDGTTFTDDESAGEYGFYLYRKQQAEQTYKETIEGIDEIATKPIADLSEKGAKIINEKLIQSIIDGVTVGSKAFEERIRENIEKGGNGIVEGLFEILARFPESNGVDRKFVEAYIANDLNAGQSRVGLGLGRSVNQDNDGDRIARHFALMSTEALQSRDYDTIVKQFREVKAMMDDISEMVAKAELKDMKKNAGKGVVLTSEDIKELSSKRRADVTALKAKLNKNYTGWLSNEYQGVTEAMSYLGIDEKGLGADVASQTKSANAMITRGFFEGLTQDAISSKKVADRIVHEYGDNAFEEGSRFFTDLDLLVKSLSDPETYKDIDGLVRKIQEMKILGEDGDDEGVFATRINELVLGTISKYGHGGEILRNLFGEEALKKHFGDKQYTDEDILKAVKNADLHLGTEQLIRALQSTHETLKASGEGGIGEVIRGRRWHVPGLMGIKGDPVSTLGLSVADLGPSYQHLFEIVDKLTGAVDRERAAEEAKIKVLGKEKAAVGEVSSEYNNLGTVLKKIADENHKTIDELTSEDIEAGYSWIKGLSKPISATRFRNMMLAPGDQAHYQKAPLVDDAAIQRALEARRKKGDYLTIDELGTTLGLRHKGDVDTLMRSYSAFNRGSFTGNMVQLQAELERFGVNTTRKNGQSDEEYVKYLSQLGKDFLVSDKAKDIGLETRRVIESYVDETKLDEHNEHTDIITLFNKLKQAEELFGGIDKSFSTEHLITAAQNIFKLLESLGMLGSNLVGTEVGSTGIVGGRPLATTADWVSTRSIEKDGKQYKQLVYGDIKSHGSDKYTAEDAFQDAVEQYAAQDLIKTLASNETLFDKEEGIFEQTQKTMLAERYRAAGLDEDVIKNIIDSIPVLSKDLAKKLVETYKAGLETTTGILAVSNKYTGEATAYETTLDPQLKALINKVAAGENLTEDEADIFKKAYGLKGTTSEYKSKDSLTYTEKEYVELLEKEYDLKIKLAKWEKEHEAQKGTASYDLLLKQKNKEIADAENASKEMAKKAGLDPNKNDLSSVKKAELGLYEESLKNKGAGGGGQKQPLLESLGYGKGNLTRMITQYFSLYRVLGKVRQEIQKVIQITKQLDQAATNIRIVTGMERQEVNNAILSYGKLAEQLGTTTTALAQSANEWLRQGYSIGESIDLVAATTQLSKLGMLDMNSATKVLTSTLKGFKMEASEAGTIVDKLTKLDMNYAASAGEIGEAMSRTSAIASQMGLSLDETAAMVTTLMDVTQQSSEMAGTAVRSILSRYGNVKTGSFLSMMTEGEDLEKINDIEKVLNVLGISIRNSKMEMRDMGEVLDELAKKWNALSSVEQNAVATAFAGTRQRNSFTVLLSNWEQVREAQEISVDSAGTAMDKMVSYADSVEASLNRLQNAWEQLTQRISQSDFLKFIYNAGSVIIKNLDRILNLAMSFITATQGYKIAPGLMNLFKANGSLTPSSTFNMALATGKSKSEIGIISQRILTVGQKIDAVRQAVLQQGSAGPKTLNSGLFNKEYRNKLIQKNQGDKDSIKAIKQFGRGRGYWTDNGKTAVYMNGSGGRGFYRIYKNGKIKLLSKDSDLGKTFYKQRNSMLLNKGIGTAATGIVSGLTAGATGPSDTFGIFKSSKGDIGLNDVESTGGDKIFTGAVTGVLSGALSIWLGPLGAMLGNIAGNFAGSLFKWFNHRDEIERKQRVEDAKKQLEVLNSIESATDGVKDAVYDLSTAEKAKAAKEKIDTLISEINKANSGDNPIDLGIDTAALEKTLLSATNDTAKDETLAEIYSVLRQWQAERKYASQEDDRVSAYTKYQEALGEAEKNLKNGKITQKEYDQEVKKLNLQYEAIIKEQNRQLWNTQLEQAYYQSRLSTWDVNKVRDDNLEDAVQIMANSLELTGQKVRKESGELTDVARTQIESFLRGTEKFNTYFNTSAKTLYKMTEDVQKRASFKDDYGYTYEDLYTIFEQQNEEVIEKLAKKLDIKLKEKGLTIKDLQKEVFGSSPKDLESFANALNITTGKALTLQQQLGNLSSVEILKNPTELREWGNELVSIFAEISTKGKVTGETLEKLNSKFFFLYNKYNSEGKLLSTSQDNISENLMQLLFSPNSTISYLYRNAEFNEFKNNTDFFDALKKDEDFNKLLIEYGKESATTLAEVDKLLYNEEVYQKKVGQLLSQVADSFFLYREMAEKLSEWQKHENQIAIDNFKSQIDALKDINKERQNEIDLIKAKEALQNAQNEKKRVYRTGVGWTYEADQQAVEEARDKLTELENQKSTEDLQYQIDLLEQQNSILDNISKNEELEALKENFDSYSTFMRDKFGHVAISSFELIKRAFENNGAELHVWDNYMADAAQKENAAKKTAESNVIDSIKGMVVNKENMDRYVRTFSNNRTGDNSKVIESQQNIYNYYNKLLEAVDTLKNTYGYSDNDIKKTIINSGMNNVYAQSALSLLGDKDAQNVTFSSSKVQAALKGETVYGVTKHGDGKFEANGLIYNKNFGIVDIWGKPYVYDKNGKYIGIEFFTSTQESLDPSKIDAANYLLEYFGEPSKGNAIIRDGDSYYQKTSSGWYKLEGNPRDQSYKDNPDEKFSNYYKTNALGTYDFEGGPSLINEFGTEGIITPQGTLTALPAHTGVVPADLTRNLYDLGEVAPTLIKRMGDTDNILNPKSLVTNEDNSMNVEQLNASFNVDSDFDFNQLLVQARQYMAMTKNKKL